MKIIDQPTSLAEIKVLAQKSFGNLVKAVVDVEKQIMAIDGQLHADEEALLINQGSKQQSSIKLNNISKFMYL